MDTIKSLFPSFENFVILPPSFGPSWIFGALGTVMVSLFGLSIGRTRAVISLLSLYIALLFELIFPYWYWIYKFTNNSIDEYWLKLGLFVAAYIIVFTIFNLSFIRRRISSGEFSLPAIMILTVLQFGLAISIILNILPRELTAGWFSNFYIYFGTLQALFIWAIAPLPTLLFIGRK